MPYDVEEEEPPSPVDNSEADEDLLKEARDRYKYACTYWQDVRDERQKDMQCICGDPWPAEDRKAREDAKRPVLNQDFLGQYVNQSLNNVRQNKRGIKVEPAGAGADEKSAEYRQNRIRAIEYRSKAQTAYETGYQQMLEGSYGFWRIGREWVSTEEDNWQQEIVIKTIPNPDSVLYDPDCKEPDWSDAQWCFVVEPMSRDQFKRQWPSAHKTDFNAEDMRNADQWISDETVLVAEYWKVEVESRKQSRKNPATGKRETRTVECRHVKQYIINGVEVLEENEQPGGEIPIPACIGLERYLDDGKGPRRRIFSLVRLARDPQLLLAYLVSQEAEEAGLSPKVPYVGYVGQFESQRKAWETATKVAHPFLEIDPIPDSANGQILPLPRRESFTPNFQQYEIAKDSASRAIMAAMGISPLPTAAMRSTEKSGVAIQRIQSEQALGSYHFVDNFERAIERTGRIIESWLPIYDGEERDVALCEPDDTRKIVRINAAQPAINPQTGQPEPQYAVAEGDHDVTVSVGPSNQSQRDAADDFANALIANLQTLQVAITPPQIAQILSLVVKLKQLGPIGDQISDIISPQQNQQIPPQLQQAMAQAGQQIQALNAHAQQLEGQVQQLTFEKNAKIVENQGRLQIEQVKAQSDLALENKKLEVQVAIAEVNTKSQLAEERAAFIKDIWKMLHEQGHEHAMRAADMIHERVMNEQQQEHERQMASQEQQAAAQQAQMAEQQPEAQQQGA